MYDISRCESCMEGQSAKGESLNMGHKTLEESIKICCSAVKMSLQMKMKWRRFQMHPHTKTKNSKSFTKRNAKWSFQMEGN